MGHVFGQWLGDTLLSGNCFTNLFLGLSHNHRWSKFDLMGSNNAMLLAQMVSTGGGSDILKPETMMQNAQTTHAAEQHC